MVWDRGGGDTEQGRESAAERRSTGIIRKAVSTRRCQLCGVGRRQSGEPVLRRVGGAPEAHGRVLSWVLRRLPKSHPGLTKRKAWGN